MYTQNSTPEMGRYLRQLVDNYFEEGQFESGIAILDQMHSPDHKPSLIHILHLIFISLHSASHDTRLDESGADAAYDTTALLHQSPRKIVKQAKSTLILSPSTIIASHRILFTLISTNSASDIAAALPHYPDNEIRRQVSTENEGNAHFGIDILDSPIYNQSAAIRNSRSVWELLKEGYTNRAMQIFGTPKARSKGKQGLKTRTLGREPSFNTSMEAEELAVVGEDSWFLLEWLVALFEKDAEVTQTQGLGKHSSLLLRQLPPPPLNTFTRWDASEPLKVVAFSLQQSDFRRQRIGLRLLNLLIDLSQTPYLNLSSLTSTALAQIASSSSFHTKTSRHLSLSHTTEPPYTALAVNLLTMLFDSLSNTLPTLAFKISLCQKVLHDANDDSVGTIHTASKTTGRATASNHVTNGTDTSNPNITSNQLPLKSALKRPTPTPRIMPRPRGAAAAGATAAQTCQEAAKTPLSQPVTSISSEESLTSSVALPGDANDTTLPPAPVVPAASLRPRLPPFADAAQLLKVQPRNQGSSSSTLQTRARSRNTGTNNTRSIPQTPWSAPCQLLRVKFELLHACVTLAKRLRDELALGPSEPPSKTDVEDWTQSLLDGRMRELLLVAFGPQVPTSSEEEKEDKAFYADIIKSVVGFPIDAV